MKKLLVLSLLGTMTLLSTSAMANNTNGAVKTVEQRNFEIQADTSGIVFRMGNVDKEACASKYHGDDNLRKICEKGWENYNIRLNQPAKY